VGNISNDNKITKQPLKIPNGRKVFRMTVNYICQHFPFQGAEKNKPKLGFFWYENKHTIWQTLIATQESLLVTKVLFP
jgi:hypothetical protein